jgi:hypothetical protein
MRLVAALAVVVLGCSPCLAVTRYVNAGLTTGANNGTSWADAYRTSDGLRLAIAASTAGDEIWVAAGTYKPTPTATRTIAFTPRTGIAVYGGFGGTETDRSQRNIAANVTILSGDLANNDPIITDNSHNVVRGNGTTNAGTFDGFTVTGGNANGSSASDSDRGGGMIFLNGANATIRNCIITGNRVIFGGGGTYLRSASPTFVDCVWRSNAGASFGGAIDMFTNCAPTFTRCEFSNNAANRAGGVEVFGTCNPLFTNCVFRNNNAGSATGGALYIASSSTVTIRNCTFASNTTTGSSGSAITTTGSTTRIFNSIVWGNTGPGGSTANQVAGSTTLAGSSNIQGGFTGEGNINLAPGFVSQATGDLRLLAGSPCIDAANNTNVDVNNVLDFLLQTRRVDDPATIDTGIGTAPIADMGAIEYQPPAGPTCDTIDFNNDGSSFDPQDVDAFFSVFSEGDCIPTTATCNDIDFNNDASLFDPCDVDSFLLVFSEGPCTPCGQ